MSIDKRLFLGIKQMTKVAFSELQDSEKVGYIWFVRCEDPVHFEIYLGTKLYGETNEIIESELEELRKQVINDEHVVADAIIRLKDRIGLDKFFELPERFRLYSSITDGVYTKDEIDEKIHGLFKFKGVFEFLSELIASGETVEGYVYQVVYRDIEQTEEGEWVPVIPPVLANSEFVYDGEKWVELGPLFDEREIEELREMVNEHTECLGSMNIISDEFIYSLFFGNLRQLVINSIGDGELLSKTGEGEYHPNTIIRIGVEPKDGSVFVGWTDGNNDQYRRVVVVDDETGNTYTAMLMREVETGTIIPLVKIGQEDMGHVEGGGTAPVGSFVTIEAIREEKTKFKQWLDENGEIASMNNPYEVEVTRNGITNFYAEFESISFDAILNNLNDIPYQSNYRVYWSGTTSGVTYAIDGVHRMYDTEFTSVGNIDNRRGWQDELDPYTYEPIHYENLLYGGNGEGNMVFVLCGVKSNNWGVYQKNGVIKISGSDGLDCLRFNYGYCYNEKNNETNLMQDIHLVVKIYSGAEENDNNLVAIYKILRNFDEWGYSDEESKILKRPFVFDSMTEYNLKTESETGELNIEGDYCITIRNYFSKTDLIKNSGVTPEEYYGDDTFDSFVKIDDNDREIVTPLSRTAIDNIEVSLFEEMRNKKIKRKKE